jgi:chromosome segregation ATPase
LTAFLLWIKEGIAAWWERSWHSADVAERRQDAADKRQDAAFNQSMQFSDKVLARLDHQDEQIVKLQIQNAEQAAQMNVQRQRIEECQEQHERCESDRERLEVAVESLQAQVNQLNVKMLPPPV